MSWWEKSIFYEIYVPSFNDSDGDGIGDLKGISEKATYLKELGIDGIWLTPFFPSPKVDNGYDISDYYSVDPIYGDMSAMETLVKCMHDVGIKVIIDLVINHTSDQHPWFQEARMSKNNSKREWYIWRDKPNNWASFFGGSAWQFDERTQQYYYHSFSKAQVDLNWTNPEVKVAIFDVIDFWIEKGIDGFRLDVVNNLTVDIECKDNPYDENGTQIHQYDVNQPGIIETIKDIKAFLTSKNSQLFTVGEISSDKLEIIQQYAGRELFDVTFNFNFGSVESFDEKKIVQELTEMQKIYGAQRLPTLFFNSHDMSRSWNRLSQEKTSRYLQLAALLLLNRGVTFLFQGEELGVGDYLPADFSDIRDIQAINKFDERRLKGDSHEESMKQANLVNRDRSRGMIPWNTVKDNSWIGYGKKNAESDTIFTWYQKLITLRKTYLQETDCMKILENKAGLLMYQLSGLVIIVNFLPNWSPPFKLSAQHITCLKNGELIKKQNNYYLSGYGIWIGRN